MVPLKITYKDPNRLKPRTTNPRTHTAKQIRQIVASIKQHGFINPILTDGADGIIAGHARVEAAKLSGMSGVCGTGASVLRLARAAELHPHYSSTRPLSEKLSARIR